MSMYNSWASSDEERSSFQGSTTQPRRGKSTSAAKTLHFRLYQMANHFHVNINTTETMEYVKGPYQVATSPTAKRTYLGTVLFVAASIALLCVAALAYPIFYYNYVPKKIISVPIHLQYK
jgi:hypothetical protein